MPNRTEIRFEDLTEEVARLVDDACCRFERDLRNHRTANLAAYLNRIPACALNVATAELEALRSEIRSRHTANSEGIKPEGNVCSLRATTGGPASSLIQNRRSQPGSPVDQLGLARFTDYSDLKPIGSGGMGVVFQAFDPRLQTDVALKFLKPEACASSSQLARFHREARLIGSLSHPNIRAIYGVNHWDGTPYLVLEWVAGESLRDWLKRRPAGEVLSLFSQVAAALAYAHSRQIAHRDVKPENVLVRSDGVVKLLDFGLARLLDDPDQLHGSLGSSIGRMIGTIGYLSPEQIAGNSATIRSDLFSLGVMLYEALTGIHPFAEASDAETLEAIEHCVPIPPSHLVGALEHRVEQLTLKLLHKEPSHRPDAEWVARILSRWSHGSFDNMAADTATSQTNRE